MNRLRMITICLITIMAVSLNVKAQEVTITLTPGWTWISFPGTDTLNFATAMGSFIPMSGDLIKSQWGNASYMNGQWRGQVSQFYPGFGYMYYSNRTTPVTVTFNLQNPAPQVVVTTSEPTNITTESAVCGGDVTPFNGNSTMVLLKGICWSLNPNPTVNDNYVGAGSGVGSFSVPIGGLAAATVYHVRAFAVTETGTFYGNEVILLTFASHDYVDLGLPSGLLWATCNVGTSSPEDYGEYFAWGETQSKWEYNLSTYQYCYGESNTLTKYCNSLSFGIFIDDLTTLLPEDDAATINWGGDWRTPTKEEWEELCQNTIHTWTTQNGMCGQLFTASNGNSLFLPAAGYHEESWWNCMDYFGHYWSSSLYTTNPNHAWFFSFSSVDCQMSHDYRIYGRSVRPVRSLPQSNALTVTTSQVTDITKTTAMGGGTVIDDGSTTVTEYGICWSTSHNPTLSCGHASSDMGTGGFSCSMTGLKANTTYYVRAYARDNIGITYGSEVSFITENYDYVDLGLPSGTLWATCNVGATVPEEYGDYFAWGETEPKDEYNFANYLHCNGSYNNTLFTKYCNNPEYGLNGYTDYLNVLEPCDDAATINWGEDWHMPDYVDWLELYYSTTNTWTTLNGVYGRLFTASNGNSLFLPASGLRIYGILEDEGEEGCYWSSLLDEYNTDSAKSVFLSSSGFYFGGANRCYGFSVRPVRSVR